MRPSIFGSMRLFASTITQRIEQALERTMVGRWVLEVWRIFWSLVKIMVPVLIVVRFIEVMGWVTLLGEAFVHFLIGNMLIYIPQLHRPYRYQKYRGL